MGLSPSGNPLISAFSPFSDHPESPMFVSASAKRSSMYAGQVIHRGHFN